MNPKPLFIIFVIFILKTLEHLHNKLVQYYQLLAQERVAEMYPAFRRLLGG